jgi:hypothetical protein
MTVDRKSKLWRQAFLAAMTGLIAGSKTKFGSALDPEFVEKQTLKHRAILAGAERYADDAVTFMAQSAGHTWELSDDR